MKRPIKLVQATKGWIEQAPRLSFFFVSKRVYDKYRREDKAPLRLTVYLKETFKWTVDYRSRDKDHYMDWLEDDGTRYGHLVVNAIRLYGEYNPVMM